MKGKILILAAAMLLVSCHENTLPEGVMDREALTAFLVDAYTLEAYNTYVHPSNAVPIAPEIASAYDDLLKRHGVTADVVDSSLSYYGHRPEEYGEILKEVQQRLEPGQ